MKAFDQEGNEVPVEDINPQDTVCILQPPKIKPAPVLELGHYHSQLIMRSKSNKKYKVVSKTKRNMIKQSKRNNRRR